MKLYTFEINRVGGMTEGEHFAPVLTAVIGEQPDLVTEIYFYRAANGQPGGPGLFVKLPPQFWTDPTTPLYVLLDPDLNY